MKHVLTTGTGEGTVQEVTPESAGWKYLGFQVHRLAAGAEATGNSGGEEQLLVFMAGGARVSAGGQDWQFSGRENVFRGRPHALYVPPGESWKVTADGPLEFAIGSAPAEGKYPLRLIRPEDVEVEIRGGHNVTRQISHILDPGDAEKLLCVEVYTPSGNWSSYPPHKHDVQNPPEEVDLEEVYHYRFQPDGGWALQRLYNDDRSLDEIVKVDAGDTVLVREGYHPVVAAPGYDAYYLNFLAGLTPSWVARDEPDLAWVRGSWEGAEDRLKLPLK